MINDIKTPAELSTILKKNNVVVVDFYAGWCEPCKMLSPILTVISNEFKQITFVKVNVDEIPTLAQKYKVMSIPTVYIFSKNKVKDKFLGFKPREQIMLWLKKNI